MDWTARLWNPKQSGKCVWTFETAEDYIYDASWNPGNAALFGTCDNDGYIDLWDLTHDLEIPLLHYKTGKSSRIPLFCQHALSSTHSEQLCA